MYFVWVRFRACFGFIALRATLAHVTCQDFTDTEWLILHQVEIVLETMAEFQHILEGESHVIKSEKLIPK